MPGYTNTPLSGSLQNEKPKSRLRVCARRRQGGFLRPNLTHSGVDACECSGKRVSLAMRDGNKEALGDDVDEFFSGQYR